MGNLKHFTMSLKLLCDMLNTLIILPVYQFLETFSQEKETSYMKSRDNPKFFEAE